MFCILVGKRINLSMSGCSLSTLCCSMCFRSDMDGMSMLANLCITNSGMMHLTFTCEVCGCRII
jgi:hypothetical protein